MTELILNDFLVLFDMYYYDKILASGLFGFYNKTSHVI